MKKLFTSLALFTLIGGIAKADVTNLFPNGNFEVGGISPTSYDTNWTQVGPVTFSYPTTGGNPNGYGVMDATVGNPWGIWVAGQLNALPIAPLGLVAGQSYAFVMDMKTLATNGTFGLDGGIKIESWGDNGYIGDSGDVRAVGVTTNWGTYSFSYTLNPGTTGIKVVPLWAQEASCGYDNIGVAVPPQVLLSEITSPAAGSTNSNVAFTIIASGTVSPAAVTNMSFYNGATLLGSDSSYPYSFVYSNAPLGNKLLTAVAQDNTGLSVTSAVVSIEVANLLPPPLTYPTNNAPTPIWPAATVKSLKNSSATYVDKTGINWFNPFGSGTVGQNYTITNTGAVVLSYKPLSYVGVELDPTYMIGGETDLSGKTHMHVDVWTTANQLGIKLVTETLGTPFTKFEAEYQITAPGPISSNNWVSLDIPLSVWTNLNVNLDLSKLIQMLWTDNFGPGVQNGTFYIDNVYFHNATPNIQSLVPSGGNLTMKVPSITGVSYVLQGTATLSPASWSNIQTNAGTGGLLNFSAPIGTGNEFFRIKTQ